MIYFNEKHGEPLTAMMNEFNRDKDVQIIHNIQKIYLLSCLTFSEECKIKRSVRVLKRPRKPNNNVTEDPRRFIEMVYHLKGSSDFFK